MPLLVRTNKGVPIEPSMALIWAETAGCDKHSRSAAWVRLRWWATVTKDFSWFRSMMSLFFSFIQQQIAVFCKLFLTQINA